jgi:hypothetical protein
MYVIKNEICHFRVYILQNFTDLYFYVKKVGFVLISEDLPGNLAKKYQIRADPDPKLGSYVRSLPTITCADYQ